VPSRAFPAARTLMSDNPLRRNPLSLRNIRAYTHAGMRQCLAYMSKSGRSLLRPFVSRCC
jgi:hypothetical protein